MSQKNELIPKRRFKEFENAEDWEQLKLGDGINKIGDGIHGTPEYNDNGKVAFINGNNLIRGKVAITNETKFVEESQKTRSDYELNFDTILMSINGTIGNLAIYNGENIMLGKSTCYLIVDKFSKEFAYYLLQTSTIKKYFLSNLTGTTIKNLGLKIIKETPCYVPQKEEQVNVGNLFKQLDLLLTLHQRKLDKLKNLKQSYLYQMFPQNGEKTPKLRFSDFNNEWEERKLGEMVGTISSGNRLPKSELTKGNVPYIVAQTKNNGVFGYISENTKDYNGNDMKLFPSNSISFSIDNPEAIFYRNEPFYTSNIMRVIHNETLSEFDYIFIIESMKMFTKSYDWSRKFSGPVVSNLKIMFPMDNEEQLKIGQFFKQLDKTIEVQEQELEKLKNLKEAYLNEMFV